MLRPFVFLFVIRPEADRRMGTRITIKMKTYMPIKLYLLFVIALVMWLNISGMLTYGMNLSIFGLLLFMYFVVLRVAENESRQAFMAFLENYIIANPRPDHDRA
jgi:hypothetical protein